MNGMAARAEAAVPLAGDRVGGSVSVALLAFVELLGCHPQVIDAVGATREMDGSTPEAAEVDGRPEGAQGAQALAYYSFDEGMGSTVHDGSGHGYNGTLVGGAWTDAGRFGSAIRFSAGPDGGVDDWIVVNPFPQAGSEGSGWSVSFWLLVQSADFTENYVTVLSTEIAMTGGWEVNILPPTGDPAYATLQFAFWIPSASAYSIATCSCLEFGSWTHFVAVVDASALTVQLFLGGVKVDSTPALGPFVQGLPRLYMGRWDGSGRQLVGVLDEVAIYDRPLSTAEVEQLNLGVVP
jgi:hypothetical protein